MARLPKSVRTDVLLGSAAIGTGSRSLAGLSPGASGSGEGGTNPMNPGLDEAARRTRSLIGNLRGEIESRRRERMAREAAAAAAAPAPASPVAVSVTAGGPAPEPAGARLPPIEPPVLVEPPAPEVTAPQPVPVPVQFEAPVVVSPEAPADDLEKQLESYFGQVSAKQEPAQPVTAPSRGTEHAKPAGQEVETGTRLDTIREAVIEDLAEQILQAWKLDEGSSSIREEVTRRLAQRILEKWARPKKNKPRLPRVS
jgi:hypothetical protein